ncbi:hypothetical protein JCM11491_001146 [Sporobolomyces phaffii]
MAAPLSLSSHLVGPAPFLDPSSPASPRILLSPSSPDFPAIDLPRPDDPTSEQNSKMDKTLRQSLLLLDTRFAEIETMAFAGGTDLKPNRLATLSEGDDRAEADTESITSDGGPINFMLARGSFSGGTTKRDVSIKSLASVASGSSSHRSSEDAFDIVDFPATTNYALSASDSLGLAISTRLPPSPRNRSSDLMSFPIPPSDVPLIPIDGGGGSAVNSVDNSIDDDQVFEQLAFLGDGHAGQGLGLYSSSRASSRFARSETEIDSASACSNVSSALDASTLASSYAQTPVFGRSTSSFKALGRDEPSTIAPLYARRAATSPHPISAPPMIFTSQAGPTASVPATLGSPFSLAQEFPPSPVSLSPFSFADSPHQSPSSNPRSPSDGPFRAATYPSPRMSSVPPSPSLSRSSSRQDFGFAELHQASVGLLGSFDDGGIPVWQTRPEDNYSRNAGTAKDEDENLEVLEDLAPPSKQRFGERSSPGSPSSRASVQSLSPGLSSPMGTLRRLSSFQILRRRGSENVLATTTTPPAPRPALTKPKSEAALSTLARRQAAAEPAAESKENLAPDQPPLGRLGRLSLRSRSSPRLSKLASPPPKTDSYFESTTPKKTSGLGSSPSPSSTSGKKRFSIFASKQFSPSPDESVPPVPPTPTQHLPAQVVVQVEKEIQVDVAKANGDAGVPRSSIAEDSDSTAATASSASFPVTPTSVSAPPFSFSASPEPVADDPITLAAFLGHAEGRDEQSPSASPILATFSNTPKQSSQLTKTPTSPFGDRTNWSRPTSPALLDALKATSPLDFDDLVIVPQQITVFPVRLPPASAGALNAARKEEEEGGTGDGGEDDYGGESDSDEDKPLGVSVPGALVAQKSLRKSISKKSSSKKPKSRPTEDPFEFEQAAALLRTPTMSGSDAPSTSTLTAVPTRSRSNTRTGEPFFPVKSSQGHDSFLPQTDASIERKASSNGLRRSPSMPLDPMIAESALTFDSPVLTHEPLPIQPTNLPSRTDSRGRTQPRSPADSASPVLAPPPRSRPPPVPAPPSRKLSTPGDASSAPATGNPLHRRPSLHPDVAHIQAAAASASPGMSRQSSNTSTKSSSATSFSAPAPSDSAYPQTRPSPGARSRSGTISAATSHASGGGGPTVEHRVYLGRPPAKHLTIKVTDRTVAGEVVAYAKAKGALEGGNDSDGGWALWEVWQSMGLERPVREYELLNDVIKSFDGDSAVFVLRRSTLWPVLSTHARINPVARKMGPVQLEVKKGKWSKRFLELKDGALSHSKSEKGKDSTTLCQVSNSSVFFVDEPTVLRLKAPKPFVFALKSRLTRANFEEVSQYCNFVSVKSEEELTNWITGITEAGNQQLRQREQAILGTTPSLPSPPLLADPSTRPSPSSFSTEPTLGGTTTTTSSKSPRGFLARATSSRPAPSVLAPTNDNTSSTHAANPKRRPTVSKPLVDILP